MFRFCPAAHIACISLTTHMVIIIIVIICLAAHMRGGKSSICLAAKM